MTWEEMKRPAKQVGLMATYEGSLNSFATDDYGGYNTDGGSNAITSGGGGGGAISPEPYIAPLAADPVYPAYSTPELVPAPYSLPATLPVMETLQEPTPAPVVTPTVTPAQVAHSNPLLALLLIGGIIYVAKKRKGRRK